MNRERQQHDHRGKEGPAQIGQVLSPPSCRGVLVKDPQIGKETVSRSSNNGEDQSHRENTKEAKCGETGHPVKLSNIDATSGCSPWSASDHSILTCTFELRLIRRFCCLQED